VHTVGKSSTCLSPTTEWYAGNALGRIVRRKIVPTWYEDRKRAKDPLGPLADGWTRREATFALS
jgi:hypothetical protein